MKHIDLSPARPDRQTTLLSRMEGLHIPSNDWRAIAPSRSLSLCCTLYLMDLETLWIPKQGLRAPPASPHPSTQGRSLQFSPPCIHQLCPICRLVTCTLLPRARPSIHPGCSVPQLLAENLQPSLVLVPTLEHCILFSCLRSPLRVALQSARLRAWQVYSWFTGEGGISVFPHIGQ